MTTAGWLEVDSHPSLPRSNCLHRQALRHSLNVRTLKRMPRLQAWVTGRILMLSPVIKKGWSEEGTEGGD